MSKHHSAEKDVDALTAEAQAFVRWAGEDSWGGQVVTDLLTRVTPPANPEDPS